MAGCELASLQPARLVVIVDIIIYLYCLVGRVCQLSDMT